jgi:hypothetical protein
LWSLFAKMLLRSAWRYFLFRGNAKNIACALRSGLILCRRSVSN